MTKQHRPSKAALPRRRSAGALSLQDPRHRHRVIPDKRRVSKMSRDTLKPFDPAFECTEWDTGTVHGLCRVVKCEHCPLWRDGKFAEPTVFEDYLG